MLPPSCQWLSPLGFLGSLLLVPESDAHIPEPLPFKTPSHSCLSVEKFLENFISQLNVLPGGSDDFLIFFF